ncbi:hypothetical protein ACYZUC_10965 [Pseudomonas sp. GT1P32]
MTEFMYRFRPVGRLLGDDINIGELDGQYIYFASPEQLNDPLEGYREIFFYGDKIIWRNLIKHYLRCLIDSCFHFLNAKQGDPLIKQSDVFASATSSSEKLNNLNESIFEKLTSEPCINEFISKIAVDRKAKRGEMLAYIQILHYYFIDIILESFYTHGVVTQRLNYFTADRNQILEYIKTASLTIVPGGHLTSEQEAEFQTSSRRNADRLLWTRYKIDHTGREHWFFLLFEYPEIFCRDIERLIYPSWYTACFMTSCSDSSIWGSYGGYHKDVCLKFKTKKDGSGTSLTLSAPNGEDKNGKTWGPVEFNFHEVSYGKQFVEIDFFRSLGQLPTPTLIKSWFMGDNKVISTCAKDMFKDEKKWRADYWNRFYSSVTVKLRAWDREKEFRLIQTSSTGDLECDEHRKLRYDFNSLEGIIFGINTSMENKLEIIKKIESLCTKFGRSEFNFYQSRYDHESSEIIYEKLEFICTGLKDSISDKTNS